MKKRKILLINTHSLSSIYPTYSPMQEDNFQPYSGGWHVRLARELVKNSDEYDIECWGMEKTIRNTISFERASINYKIFPSCYFKFLGEISIPLLKELKKEVEQQDILIHLHSVFNYTTYLVPFLVKNVPIVVQHHGDKSSLQFFYDNMNENRVKAAAYLLLYLLKPEWLFERTAFKKINQFFVLNEDAEKYLTNIVGMEKVQRLTMGIDFGQFRKMDKAEARKSLGLELDTKYILFIGAFVKKKGLDYLLQAFPMVLREHPDSFLLLAGDGYYKNDIELLTKELEIQKNVRFLGFVDDEQLPFLYNAADVFVLPSVSEGLPVVVLEGLACETPFVGTTVGGIPDIVRNFNAGVLVPPKNSVALANAITSFFKDFDKNFKVGRENARRYYSWESIVKRTLEVYDELWEQYYA